MPFPGDDGGMSPLVRVDELVSELSAGAPVRLLDVRWRLNQPEGRPDYLAAHLPGAVYVDLERELARPGRPEEGRHPLPEREDLEASARRWGVHAGDRVVAYDDNDGVAAARAWWTLRRHGVDVRVLDGGFRAWIAAGLRVEASDRAVRPGDIVLDGVRGGRGEHRRRGARAARPACSSTCARRSTTGDRCRASTRSPGTSRAR